MKRSQEKVVKPYVSKRSKTKDNSNNQTPSTTTNKKESETKHHTKAITRIQWHPSLDIIASSSLDSQIIIWDTSSKDGSIQSSQCFSGHTEAVKDLRWSRDGLSLLTASFDKSCKILDGNTGKKHLCVVILCDLVSLMIQDKYNLII